MMTCEHCRGVEREFNDRVVRRQLRRLRRKGPDRVTRLLIEALRRASAGRHRDGVLLDVGSGVGAIPRAMVGSDVARAVLIEASPASLAAAREEAERSAMATRVDLRQGDFVDLAAEVPAADIVTLNRVICCYPDMPRLVGLSASKARELYGAVYPRDVWWMRAFMRLYNAWQWVRRSPARYFVHRHDQLERWMSKAGYRNIHDGGIRVWRVVLYRRAEATR